MDLVGRKLRMEDGRLPHRFFDLIEGELALAGAVIGARPLVDPVTEALGRLRNVTARLQERSIDPAEIGSAAADYLRMFSLVSFGWMWTRMAAQALAAGENATVLHYSKVAVARFFVERILPQILALDRALAAGSVQLMALEDADF